MASQTAVWAENSSILHSCVRGIRFWHSRGLLPDNFRRPGLLQPSATDNFRWNADRATDRPTIRGHPSVATKCRHPGRRHLGRRHPGQSTAGYPYVETTGSLFSNPRMSNLCRIYPENVESMSNLCRINVKFLSSKQFWPRNGLPDSRLG